MYPTTLLLHYILSISISLQLNIIYKQLPSYHQYIQPSAVRTSKLLYRTAISIWSRSPLRLRSSYSACIALRVTGTGRFCREANLRFIGCIHIATSRFAIILGFEFIVVVVSIQRSRRTPHAAQAWRATPASQALTSVARDASACERGERRQAL